MSSKGSVLIVSADNEAVELLRQYFSNANYHILLASSKDEALGNTRQWLPQAIIIDSDVPGLDIAALCSEVRASPRTRHIHITLLTQQTRQDERLQALSSGADEFMPKPVDAEELGLRLRNALRRAQFQNLVDPVTGLPGPRLIEEELRQLLRRQDEWALIRSNLPGFKSFNTVYGFLAGEEVLRFVAHTFSQTVEQLGSVNDFLGHAGGDNFVVITRADRGEAIHQALRQQVNAGLQSHYSFREREQGYMIIRSEGVEQQVPLMSLQSHLITSQQGPFYDIFELTQAQ